MAFVEERNRLFLQPLTHGFIRSLRGSLKGRALDILYEERRRDREL